MSEGKEGCFDSQEGKEPYSSFRNQDYLSIGCTLFSQCLVAKDAITARRAYNSAKLGFNQAVADFNKLEDRMKSLLDNLKQNCVESSEELKQLKEEADSCRQRYQELFNYGSHCSDVDGLLGDDVDVDSSVTSQIPQPSNDSNTAAQSSIEELKELLEKHQDNEENLVTIIEKQRTKMAEDFIWYGWKWKCFAIALKCATLWKTWNELKNLEGIMITGEEKEKIESQIIAMKTNIQDFLSTNHDWMNLYYFHCAQFDTYYNLKERILGIKANCESGHVKLNDIFFTSCTQAIDNGVQCAYELSKLWSVWDDATPETLLYSFTISAISGALTVFRIKAAVTSWKAIQKILIDLKLIEEWEKGMKEIDNLVKHMGNELKKITEQKNQKSMVDQVRQQLKRRSIAN